MKTEMPVTQMWFSTPVDYLKVADRIKEQLTDTLLKIEGVCEVGHYSEFNICCNITSDSDLEAFFELQAIRSRVEAVFKSFKVWPFMERDTKGERAPRAAAGATIEGPKAPANQVVMMTEAQARNEFAAYFTDPKASMAAEGGKVDKSTEWLRCIERWIEEGNAPAEAITWKCPQSLEVDRKKPRKAIK